MNILDTIFPRWCIGCGHRLINGERYLCLHCLAELPRTYLYLNPESNNIAHIYYDIHFVKRAIAYATYIPNNLTSTIVKTFKYKTKRYLATYCGQLMAKEIAATLHSQHFFEDIDIIIPVPLTFRRTMWRGYNQSEYLAKGISDITQLPICTNLLKRKAFKGSQTTKSVWERNENVKNMFSVNNKKIEKFAGKHLLLVDDVITIGATTRSCCEALSTIPNITVSIISFATAHYK